MLWNLYIENIAVAKQLDIEFNDGFTVLTGQTGAGKSIIIDSLLLLCGAKNGRELIRTGEERAYVSAIFHTSDSEKMRLEALGYSPDENGEIQVSRQINSDGRSVAKIGKRSVPLSALKEISQILINIQTQTERSAFADKSTYVSLIDMFADSAEELREYSEHYSVLTEVRGKIDELKSAMKERDIMLDILRYQKKEIESAKLTADDEEERLIRLRNKLKSAERVSKYAGVVTKALAYSEKGATVVYLLERAEAALTQLSDVVEGADEMIAKLSNFRYEVIDIAEQIKDAFDDEILENPAEKLTQIESRLSLIERLEKKYGATIPEIKAKRAEIAARIADLEEGDIKLTELERELSAIKEKAAQAAAKLSAKRSSAAAKLADEIAGSLKFLDMPKVRFKISVVPVREKTGEPVFKADGCDDVDFLISVNVGEEMQSLGKVSSGGELSRITLAIKTALAEKNDSGTLVFDEIDAGVSGGTSERIGIMLDRLGKNAQVISVTHSPQIASIASTHFLISKREIDGRTESSVREITGDERTAEIARIIGGISVTEKQTAAAQEMLNKNVNNFN
ncbi:MAG: DNA repair protein RecN [Ruminococcaceae bacterium]|nr:DNA repair protein RecN [Oscillospiraceae bacterium]